MDNRHNDNTNNKDRIKSGIDARRSQGERPRQMHKKGRKASLFPTEDPVFEMESTAANAADKPEKSKPKTSERNANASHTGRPSRGKNDPAGSVSKKSHENERSNGKKRKLDTSFTTDARGISHVQRKRKQTRRDLIKIVSAILAALFVLAAAALFRNFTVVKTITVSGSKKYGQDQLISLSGLQAGKSIFSYSAEEVTDAMNSVSDIHTKSVKKIFPNKIDIVVEDVVPRAALLGSNGNYTVISADGYVISIGENKPEGLLEVLGLAGYSFALNTYIDRTDRNIRTVGALELIKALDESELNESALYIDVSGATYTVLGLENNYKVVLGAITTAPECLYAAAEAYRRFLPVYPDGGTLNVFHGSTVVDFTPLDPKS